MPPYFTAHNYNIIASVMSDTPPEAMKWQIIEKLAGVFGVDNPRFDKERFFRACMESESCIVRCGAKK